MNLQIKINGTAIHAVLPSVTITKDLNGRSSQASFDMALSPAGTFPAMESEVIIYNALTAAKIFRGFITSTSIDQKSVALQVWKVGCVGLEYLLQNVSINQTWTGMTDRQIIQDAFTTVLPEITTADGTVSQLLTAIDYVAKDQTLIELMKQISALSGADWRVNEDKALVYYPSGSILAPFGFSDKPNTGGSYTIGPASMTSPAPGSTLTGSTVTFQWNAGSGTQYGLWVADSFGVNNLASPPASTLTSVTVTGLPTDGRMLYVRLWSLIGGSWQSIDYTYTAA